jgi:hypothetical protein
MKLAPASKFQNVLVAQQCMLNLFVIRYQIGPIYTGKQSVLDAQYGIGKYYSSKSASYHFKLINIF